MFIYISAMIKSIAEAFKSLCDYLTKNKEKQVETDILKDKNRLKNASDITEQIFWLTREYFAADSQFTMWVARSVYDCLDNKEKRLFKRFYKQKGKIKKQIEKKQKDFERNN